MRHPRDLPRTDVILALPGVRDAPHGVALAAARSALDAARARLVAGEAVSYDALIADVHRSIRAATQPSLVPVINTTGVVLHTNLGRAPWSEAAVAAAAAVARGYSNLELRLEDGARGGRGEGARALLAELSGAEDALIVNNGAAALLLALTATAAGREVITSRGELVEIGGSFRVPEIITACGARLVEVGTTNRTRAADLVRAIGADSAVILRVHPSNFRVSGFVEQVSAGEAASVARAHGLVSVFDVGSGSLDDLGAEPGIRPAIAAGVDLVTCSGDKLLGGPQAGLILGRASLIARLRAHPLYRALRVDKVTLAALEATLRGWRDGDLPPVARMMAAGASELAARATRLAAALAAQGVAASARPSTGLVGGGSLPGEGLASFAVEVRGPSAHALAARLRTPGDGLTAVVARAVDGAVWLDVRTVPEADEGALIAAVCAAVRAVDAGA